MITSVKIGDVTYSVTEVDEPKFTNPDGSDETKYFYGVIDHITNAIQIRREMDDQTKRPAIVHEILHGILHQTGLLDDQEEHYVQAVSYGLVAVLRHNPELVDYLLGLE